jgi:hypothetical protein
MDIRVVIFGKIYISSVLDCRTEKESLVVQKIDGVIILNHFAFLFFLICINLNQAFVKIP